MFHPVLDQKKIRMFKKETMTALHSLLFWVNRLLIRFSFGPIITIITASLHAELRASAGGAESARLASPALPGRRLIFASVSCYGA